jgi:hypothetical protein
MPRISTAIDRANTILRAHGTPFRLRAGHGSRWLSVYESRLASWKPAWTSQWTHAPPIPSPIAARSW